MKKTYAAAAVLCLLAAIIRTIDGESTILASARLSMDDARLLGFVHLTWYLVTIVFVVAGLFLGWLARSAAHEHSSALPRFLGVLFVAWSLTIVATGFAFGWHPGIVIPAIVTLAVGALSLSGARTHTSS
ncbi:MAG: hypothetical protein KDD65_19155 [Bacteroidetes bacterium]|nr:hypothetical protein [Bacteroidota bacterium]